MSALQLAYEEICAKAMAQLNILQSSPAPSYYREPRSNPAHFLHHVYSPETLQTPPPTYPPPVVPFGPGLTSSNSSTVWKGEIYPDRLNLADGVAQISRKLFIGGISKHITEAMLTARLIPFDPDLVVVRPESRQSKGYVYVIMSSNYAVANLLKQCHYVMEGGFQTFHLPIIYLGRVKQLQLVPWSHTDNRFISSVCPAVPIPKRHLTVFVGALHGRLHARAISQIFGELFGDVMDVHVDTDKYNYPTGFGRISFLRRESYVAAINANYVHIDCAKINKRVQIEPYIDGQECSLCSESDVPNFCRELTCFAFFCNSCWLQKHNSVDLSYHEPVRRKSKSSRRGEF